MCLQMKPDKICDHVASSYTSKQSGESLEGGDVVIAKSSRSQARDISCKMHHRDFKQEVILIRFLRLLTRSRTVC